MPALSALRVLRNASTGDENNTVSLVSVSDTEDPVLQNTELPTAMKEAVETLLGAGHKVYLPSGTVVIDGEGYLAYVGVKEDTGKVVGGVFGAGGGVVGSSIGSSGVSAMANYIHNIGEVKNAQTQCPMEGIDSWGVCKISGSETANIFFRVKKPSYDFDRYVLLTTTILDSGSYKNSRKSGTVPVEDMEEYQNNYVFSASNPENYCHEAGYPLSGKRTIPYGNKTHTYWKWSEGAKFFTPSEQVVKEIDVRNKFPSGLDGFFKLSPTTGTYQQYDGADTTYYYHPKGSTVSTGEVIPVSGKILEKADSRSSIKSNQQVIADVGFPIEAQGNTCDQGGQYQKFYGGTVYNITDAGWFAFDRQLYTIGAIRDEHDNNGGSCGQYGYPTNGPEIISGLVEQSFESGDILQIKSDGTIDVFIRDGGILHMDVNNPDWSRGFKDALFEIYIEFAGGAIVGYTGKALFDFAWDLITKSGKRVAFKNTLRVVSGPFGFALTGASVALALKENRIVHDYCKQNRGDDPSNWIEGEPQQYWCGVVSGRGLMLTMGVVAGGYYAKKTKPLIGTRIVSEVKDIQREILGSNLFGAKINGVNGQVVEIPKTSDWDVKITDNGNGKMYFDKNNQSGNWVRIHQEGRYSAFPKTYQNPYVKAQINGTPVLDIDGDEHIIISSLEI
jgi:hypothetical protein